MNRLNDIISYYVAILDAIRTYFVLLAVPVAYYNGIKPLWKYSLFNKDPNFSFDNDKFWKMCIYALYSHVKRS